MIQRIFKNTIVFFYYLKWRVHYHIGTGRKNTSWDAPALLRSKHGWRLATKSLSRVISECLKRDIDVYSVHGGYVNVNGKQEPPGLLLKNPPASLLKYVNRSQYLQKRAFESHIFPESKFWWIEMPACMLRKDMKIHEFTRLRSEFVAEILSAINQCDQTSSGRN